LTIGARLLFRYKAAIAKPIKDKKLVEPIAKRILALIGKLFNQLLLLEACLDIGAAAATAAFLFLFAFAFLLEKGGLFAIYKHIQQFSNVKDQNNVKFAD
jgi:hypothetical protein